MKAQTVVNSSIVRPLQYAPQNPVFEHGVYQEYVTGLMGTAATFGSVVLGPTYVRVGEKRQSRVLTYYWSWKDYRKERVRAVRYISTGTASTFLTLASSYSIIQNALKPKIDKKCPRVFWTHSTFYELHI